MRAGSRFASAAVLGAAAGGGIGALFLDSPAAIDIACLCLAALGLLAVALDLARKRRWGRWLPRPAAQLLLVALGGLGFAAGQNFFRGHQRFSIHPTDFAHYYLAARYFPQIEYTRLYTCMAVAMAELRLDTTGWSARDLATYETVPIVAMQVQAPACHERFGRELWPRFVDDVRVLASLSSPRLFRFLLNDHGFNATPVWTLLPSAAIHLVGGASAATRLLVWVDPLLVALGGLLLLWSFGPRTFALAMLFYGTHSPNRFEWTGASLLRLDWWFWCVVSLVALQRRYRFLSGAACAYASLLRVFPVLVGLGPLLAFLFRRRRAVASANRAPEARRFLAGLAAGTVALGGLSVVLTPIDAWQGFFTNLENLRGSATLNAVSLKSVLSHAESLSDLAARSSDSQPFNSDSQVFKQFVQLRANAFERRRPAFAVALLAAIAALIVIAARGRTSSSTLGSLSLCLVPIALDLSSYYTSVLALLAVAARRTPSLRLALVAACLATQVAQYAHRVWLPVDSYFELLSAVDVALVVVFLISHTRRAFAPEPTEPTEPTAATAHGHSGGAA